MNNMHRESRANSDSRFIQFGAFVLVFFSVSCSFFYVVTSLKALSYDVRILHETIQPSPLHARRTLSKPADFVSFSSPPSPPPPPPAVAESTIPVGDESVKELLERVRDLSDRLNSTERKLVRLFNAVDPWERCLRFVYRGHCAGGTGLDGPEAPCIVDVLKEMIYYLTEAMEAAGVTYWLSYGTLLGSVRNHSIIPWTSDVDIVVPGNEYALMQAKLKKVGILEKNGYLFFYDKKYPDIGRMCVTDDAKRYLRWAKAEFVEKLEYYNAYPYADIYQTSLRERPGVVSVKYGPTCKWDERVIFPLSKVRLYDREMFAPHNQSQYLYQLYGPDYMTPPRIKNGHGLYSEACKKEWNPLV